ncbi:MAG: hypothetical protein ACR2LY_05295 [Thermoleophilaceae bacterium]
MIGSVLVRRVVILVLAVSLLGAVLAAEASANVLSLSRAKARTLVALKKERDLESGVAVTCRRKTSHRVRCSLRYDDPELRCTGLVFVELGHRTGRVRTNTADVDCISKGAVSE